MKCLARSYFWWPSLNKEIEDIGKKCDLCIQNRPERSDPISPWRLTSAPCDRVHVDHFSFRGAEYFVLVDSYSKWIETYAVRSLTSEETIEKVAEFASKFGAIGTLVSDNGTAVSSKEFRVFCTNHGIKHLTTAPYSPCSNGTAENAVKTVKNALQKLSSDSAFKRKSVTWQLNSFLEMYRATHHATTGESSYKLMFGREMRCRFDKLKANSERRHRETIEDLNVKKKNFNFELGETVYVRDYRNPKKPLWVRAKITKKIGAVLYECVSEELGIIKRRSHQLLKYTFDDYENDASNSIKADAQLNDNTGIETNDESVNGPIEKEEEPVVRPGTSNLYVTRYNRVMLPPSRFGGE
ncbi:uncharacterized protein K02A2.6-like [Wyeomyia smithii]|uniref:uncharacterized protein K02A2.6-like n=1 Tax=Wyeomyia smithii TaxID=174621 RepID=UPI0024681922|nr:uncharacterized protein K02A2.6-like [Wyeomyia smithii]